MRLLSFLFMRSAASTALIPFLFLAFLLLALACGEAESRPGTDGVETVVVGAAASLTDALEALRPVVAATGIEMVINAAGSNVIAQQVDASDAIDVFLSADTAWVDHLSTKDRLVSNTRCAFLSNGLSVIAATAQVNGPRSVADLVEDPPRHLVMADPDAVPAGRYARRALESVDIDKADGTHASAWHHLIDRVAATADVRAALAMTAADPESVGIVYTSDLRATTRVRRLFDLPDSITPTIRYVGAVTAGGAWDDDRRDSIRRFLAVLGSSAAARVFSDHGFTPLPCPRWTATSAAPSA